MKKRLLYIITVLLLIMACDRKVVRDMGNVMIYNPLNLTRLVTLKRHVGAMSDRAVHWVRAMFTALLVNYNR